MVDRTDDITRVFQELHGGAVKQTLHDAAVELLITQRVPVKPEAVQQAKTFFKKTDAALADKYNALKAQGYAHQSPSIPSSITLTPSTPLVNELAVVLHHILSNKRVAGCLAVPGAATAAAAATPLTVQRLTFEPGASPATPLTTPGMQLYTATKAAAPAVPVHPQRLFQSPMVVLGQDGLPGSARLGGSTKKVLPQENPLFDGQAAAEAASSPPDADAVSRGQGGLTPARTPSRRAVEPARAVVGGSPGTRAHALATASSRARQINREELSRRIAARQARTASTRKPRDDDAEDGAEAPALDEAEEAAESPLPPDALPGAGLGGRHWYPGHLQAEEPPPRGDADTPGQRVVHGWRTKRLDCYKRGPAVPLCGDLFLVGQPAEGPPACPRMPAWWSDRAFQTTDFLLLVERPEGVVPMTAYPAEVQESIVVNDLLYTFAGFNGHYVYAMQYDDSGSICFHMDSALDPSLMELVSRLLPLAEYTAVIQRFVETRSGYGWGTVAQSVAACMRALLDDWEVMVMQLEHQLRVGRLSLQGLWFHCQQPLVTLRLLAGIAAEASRRGLRGAGLLDLLSARQNATAGDVQALRVVQQLLKEAARPYFGMLQRWMCEGVVEDPYAEFMVQEDKNITKATLSEDEQSAYWLHKYTLRVAFHPETNEPLYDDTGLLLHDVPQLLYAVKDTILTTGKYLNAIRECGKQPSSPLEAHERLQYDPHGLHVQQIHRAFRGSSVALLSVMKHELGLMQRLTSLKHYFLCDRGDLLLAFVDMAEEELNKRAHEVSTVRLQSMFDLAVRTSSASSDPTSDDLCCLLDHRSLLGMLKHILRVPETMPAGVRRAGERVLPNMRPAGVGAAGSGPGSGGLTPREGGLHAAEQKLLQARTGREAFLLTYRVDWPLSVVISEQSLTQYQLVFRHLFELKYVERELNTAWRVYQTTKALPSVPDGTLRHCYSLCQQMSHFFREYLLYLTFEVLEPLWHVFEAQAAAATNIDEIVGHHQALLRRVMKGCLLSRRVKLLRTLVELKALALKFTEVTARIRVPEAGAFAAFEVEDDARPLHDFQKRRLRRETASDAARQCVEAATFDKAVRELQTTFDAKYRDFIVQIGEIYKGAQKHGEESREEVDSLHNLINRLDFNGWLQRKGSCVDVRTLVESTGM